MNNYTKYLTLIKVFQKQEERRNVVLFYSLLYYANWVNCYFYNLDLLRNEIRI